MPVLKHEIKTFYYTKFGCGVWVSSASALGFNTWNTWTWLMHSTKNLSAQFEITVCSMILHKCSFNFILQYFLHDTFDKLRTYILHE